MALGSVDVASPTVIVLQKHEDDSSIAENRVSPTNEKLPATIEAAEHDGLHMYSQQKIVEDIRPQIPAAKSVPLSRHSGRIHKPIPTKGVHRIQPHAPHTQPNAPTDSDLNGNPEMPSFTALEPLPQDVEARLNLARMAFGAATVERYLNDIELDRNTQVASNDTTPESSKG